MKQVTFLKAIAGFIILFISYHTAEYAILFLNSTGLFLAGFITFFALTFIVAKWNGFSVKELGLAHNKKTFSYFFCGLAIGLFYAGAAFEISLLTGMERISFVPAPEVFISQTLYFALGTVLTSLSEDIFTRGYIYKFLQHKLNAYYLTLLSATVFVFNHIYRYNDGALLFTHLFVLGILLIIPLIITGQLWLTTGIHLGMNMIYQVTNNVMHAEEGNNHFSPLAVLVISEAAIIPFVIFISYKFRKSLPAKQKGQNSYIIF